MAFSLAACLEGGWNWEDRLGECSYDTENGLQLHASNNCHLCQINWNAPRILRPIDEDIAVEPVCNPFGDDRPYAGGVVIWKDESNYLYVVRGEFGKNDIAFMGCIGGREALIGRGRLICHGPYPEGTAIGFESFELWGK